jgi:hypothetical protein
MRKSCKFKGSEIAKKSGFRMFSKNSKKFLFKLKWFTKRSKTKQKEAKKAKRSQKERKFD